MLIKNAVLLMCSKEAIVRAYDVWLKVDQVRGLASASSSSTRRLLRLEAEKYAANTDRCNASELCSVLDLLLDELLIT